MKTTTAALLALTLLLLSPLSATAASPWGLELRGGLATPTEDLGQQELEAVGVGFELTGSYRFLPHLAAYAGWGWYHFSTEENELGGQFDAEQTGYCAGLRFEHPLGHTSLSWILRAGVTLEHIEVEDDEGDLVADSDHGLGWEVGFGLAVPLGEQWRLTPGVRYRSLSRELADDSPAPDVDADMGFFAFEVGIARSF